ncbi:hypothetical protein ACFW16_34955 [Inquilinus sp. NPDC058860]|uniref:hypothetical protein n=1 Tax=Inquilinus sp. NPDC058860 TaxID=3346652 RepID=UPI0036C236DD
MRTILIVEDEPFSRMVAEAAAQELGLVPLAAQSGEEGIALAQARETLKILFTDINMPPGPRSLGRRP